MSQHFNSLGSLANFMLNTSAKMVQSNLNGLLDQIGSDIAQEAENRIGHYQSGIGPYPAWAPLSPFTLADKAQKGLGLGGNPDTPLYATGRFRNDIGYKVQKRSLSVDIGTGQPHIVYTELGTSKMPSRPVFGPSALAVMPKFLPAIAVYAAAGIGGVSMRAFPQAGSPVSFGMTP